MFASSKWVLLGLVASMVLACIALAQAPGPVTPGPIGVPAASPLAPADGVAPGWRPPSSSAAPGIAPGPAAAAAPAVPHRSHAKVSSGTGTLPNDKGQVWREYDISPYTLRVTSTNRPEQAIVDWILRETGYEAWHSDPVGLLSADHRTLRVYHTPEMQAVVADMVDRFVNSEAETQAFGLRICSIGNPSWRAKAVHILRPIDVKSQGIQAWMMPKEDAALLIADMHKRTDFREYNSPYLLVNNGQSTVVPAITPRNYTSAVILHPEQVHPGFAPQVSQFQEGFSLEFSPLLSLDGKSVDAMFKCTLDQIERFVPVTIDVPTTISPRQHTDIEVPQWVSYRLHERFHWPTDQVLLISFGVVATPVTVDPAVKIPMINTAQRAELLIFADCRGAGGKAPTIPQGPGQASTQGYRSRY